VGVLVVVSDVLRHKGHTVITVDPSVDVQRLVNLLTEQRVGAAVVSSDGVQVEGIVSERDVVVALASHGAAALDLTVWDICSRDVALTSPGESVDVVMSTMTERRFRHLPVVVAGELRGLVSIGDVVKARVSELEVERGALASYITGTQ